MRSTFYACNVENSESSNENLFVNSDKGEVRNDNDCGDRAGALNHLSDNLNNSRNEVRQLKDLLLLHLDLIQQQSEQLLNKEKLISTLKQENESLKQRLNRMDRRISLKRNVQSSPSRSPQSPTSLLNSATVVNYPPLQSLLDSDNVCFDDCNSTEIDTKDNIPLLHDYDEISNTNSENISIADCIEQNELFMKREENEHNSLNDVNIQLNLNLLNSNSKKFKYTNLGLNSNLGSRFSSLSENFKHFNNFIQNDTELLHKSKLKLCGNSNSVIGENDGKVINKIVLQKLSNDSQLCIDNNLNDINDVNNLTVACEEVVSNKEHMSPNIDDKTDLSQVNCDSSLLEPGHSKSVLTRIRALSNCSQNSTDSNLLTGLECVNRPSVKKKYKGSLLTTSQEYYIDIGEMEFGGESIDIEPSTKASALEVPRWREHNYTTSYDLEGVENIDDSVFAKRHAKWEVEEKRRKRWDVQRIREQRIVERLKSRQSRQSLMQTAVCPSDPELNAPPVSLWPAPHEAQFLHLTEQLPVCALGEGVPVLAASEFSLPWYNSETSKRQNITSKGASKNCRRRRREIRQRNKR